MNQTTVPKYLRARVSPGAKRELIEHVGNDLWRVSVREKAEQGAANRRVRALLARALGARTEDIVLVKGTTSPSKTFLLRNPRTS